MAVLPIILALLSCALGLFSSPNANSDIDSLGNLVQELEQRVLDVQSQAKTQEQKYSAVLSSVLSKLAVTTDDLTKVNTELKDVKTNYKSLQNELTEVKDRVRSNENEICILSKEINSTINNLTLFDTDAFQRELLNLTEKNLEPFVTDLKTVKTELHIAVENLTSMKSQLMEIKSAQIEIEHLNHTMETVKEEVQVLASEVNNVAHEKLNHTSELTTNGTSMMLNATLSEMNQRPGQQHVAFIVEHSSDFKAPPGKAVLNFNSLLYKCGNGYDPSNGTFKAPHTGVYIFWLTSVIKGSKGSDVTITVESTTRIFGSAFKNIGTDNKIDTLIAFTVAHVTKGELVCFKYSSSGREITYSGPPSYGGILINNA